MCKEEFIERVIFENSPKLCWWFVKNFENNTGVGKPKTLRFVKFDISTETESNQGPFFSWMP